MNKLQIKAEFGAARFLPPRPVVERSTEKTGAAMAGRALAEPPSPELKPLLEPGCFGPPLAYGSSLRRCFLFRAQRGALTDDAWEEAETRSQAIRGGSPHFMVGRRGTSSGPSSQDDQQGQGQAPTRQHSSLGIECAASDMSDSMVLKCRSHMSEAGATLADRCVEHQRRFGDRAMASFLRESLFTLLPAFVRDLASNLLALNGHLTASSLDAAARPVANACEELFGILRPLYRKYQARPCDLADVRNILCATQKVLEEEAVRWSGSAPQLHRIMFDTVNPLFAIIVLSCVSPPKDISASHGRLGNGAGDEP